jgi:hypothetical protein
MGGCEAGYGGAGGVLQLRRVFNPLDLTACNFPVLFADKTLDKARENFKPLSEIDRLVQQTYDPEVHGAPACLQHICKRLEEEEVLEIVEGIVADLLEKSSMSGKT